MTVFSEARSSLRAVIGYNETSQIAEEKKDYEARKESFQAYYANIEQYMVTKAGKESYAAIGKALEGYWTKSDSIMSAGSTTDVGASAKHRKQNMMNFHLCMMKFMQHSRILWISMYLKVHSL